MQTAERRDYISVEDYLANEKVSEVRHEYIGGTVYAMAETSDEHNIVAGNLFASLHSHLRGKTCRVFMVDHLIRLEVIQEDVLYYPDVMVFCDPRDTDRYFKRFPKVLVEVLSEATERTDRREKFLSYTQIETLEEYVLAAQDRMEITVFRRSTNWQPEIIRKPDERLRLASIDFEMPLETVYENVRFTTPR